jgi:hypothetical protein
MKAAEVQGDVMVNRNIMLKLTLKIYDILLDLDRPAPNGDKVWIVGEQVRVA